MAMTFIDAPAAPRYAELFYSQPEEFRHRAFPIDGKRPLVKGWHKPHGERQATQWRYRFANATGIGLRMGPTPGGLSVVVVDVDDRLDLPAELRDLENWWTWCVQTPRRSGSVHLYGVSPPGERYETTRHGKGGGFPWGQYKAKGSFVAAPGSLHPNGGIYRALDGWGEGEPPQFPQEMLEALFATAPALPARSTPRARALGAEEQDALKLPASTPQWALHADAQLGRSEDTAPPIAKSVSKQGTLTGEPAGALGGAEQREGMKNGSGNTPRAGVEDHLRTVQAGGRNRAIFNALRDYAKHVELPATYPDFLVLVEGKAREYHELLPDVQGKGGYRIRESLATATSVARYWWPRRIAFRYTQQQRGRLSGAVRRDAVSERDQRIIELHVAGWSLRRIAAEEGMSARGVHHVVHRDMQQLEIIELRPETAPAASGPRQQRTRGPLAYAERSESPLLAASDGSQAWPDGP